MKKKIAVLESSFMRYYLNFLLKICEKNDIKVDYFSFDKPFFESRCVENFYILKTRYNPKVVQTTYDLENEIKNLVDIQDYDYFLCDCVKLSFSCNVFHNLSLAGKISCTKNPIIRKLLLFIHRKRILLQLQHFCNCPKIFAVSNIVKENYVKFTKINPEKIVVLYPGTNNSDEKIEEKQPTETFVIGAIACGFITKGGYNVLGALRKLVKKYKNVRAIIINPKAEKQIVLKFYMKLFGLEKYVTFLPFQKNINEFYKKIDCFICASKYEAFGRVVTEAMTRRVPVVVGSNIGASEILKDGENGFIFTADDNLHSNLANKIEEVMQKSKDKMYMDKLKDDALKTAISYTWDNFASGIFEELYK